MVRLLLFLLGTVSFSRPTQPPAAGRQSGDLAEEEYPAVADRPGHSADPGYHGGAGALSGQGAGGGSEAPGGPGRRRRVPRRLKWGVAVAVLVLIFRRAIAATALMTLSAAAHLIGFDVHLPSIRFAWPWQTVGAGATTNVELGPWVLQKIEGIAKPALGQANFSFVFTHKVSKSIAIWPCWYASTFYAVGHASATVNLNPGPAWWAQASGHYRLQVLSRPQSGQAGHVAVTMVLPRPQLPQSVHDVTIDNLPSRPIATQHSWTYPGFGCGAVLRPQFPDSVLYAQAQRLAFYRSTRDPRITRPLIRTAEAEATQTMRDSFVQPTVNALGYKLDSFIVRWAATP